VVPKARLELARAVAHHPLKMACLPVPPLRPKRASLFSKVRVLSRGELAKGKREKEKGKEIFKEISPKR